jgi:hypothetical protein
MNKINKLKKKSIFATELSASRKAQFDKSLSLEERKARRYEKLEAIFSELANKENRYLFYCPDIPFANSMVKIIYEYAYRLKNLNYTVRILHEVKGFKPDWLDYEWRKDIPISYLQEKKNNRFTTPVFSFRPTDSLIIPDGFWTVMENVSQLRTLHKIILAFGYGGIITAKPGLNWGTLGFQDVICMSERIRDDYKILWPNLNYYVIGYELELDLLKPLSIEQIKPIIGVMARSREDASQLINIFYARYPFLDMFEFRILKKMTTHQYLKNLKECAVMVFIDEQAGHPAPPLEAIASNVPVIGIYGRGMDHLAQQEGCYWIQNKDIFLLAEELATFCMNWIKSLTKIIENKKILNNYKSDIIIDKLLMTFEDLQQFKVKTFVAIKEATEKGILNDEQIIDENEKK